MTATELATVRRMARDGTARRLRRDAGLSIRDIAVDVGATLATISRWETGQRVPRRGLAVERYAALLQDLLELGASA